VGETILLDKMDEPRDVRDEAEKTWVFWQKKRDDWVRYSFQHSRRSDLVAQELLREANGIIDKMHDIVTDLQYDLDEARNYIDSCS